MKLGKAAFYQRGCFPLLFFFFEGGGGFVVSFFGFWVFFPGFSKERVCFWCGLDAKTDLFTAFIQSFVFSGLSFKKAPARPRL